MVLKSVNNLSDIIVALECGLALSCKAHNLDLAAETFEDVLKVWKIFLSMQLLFSADHARFKNFVQKSIPSKVV